MKEKKICNMTGCSEPAVRNGNCCIEHMRWKIKARRKIDALREKRKKQAPARIYTNPSVDTSGVYWVNTTSATTPVDTNWNPGPTGSSTNGWYTFTYRR